MTYSIIDNYSVLNNYSYHGKSRIISALDWWSTPCRRVLGGRNVSLKSLTYEHPMSTCCRATTAFFSVVFFPIGILSVICFTAKLLTFPCIWEKNRVITTARAAQNAVREFKDYCRNGNLERAMQLLDQNPRFPNRDDVCRKLFRLANQRINQGVAWETISPALARLSTQDAITLINHAFKIKIEEDSGQNRIHISAQDVIRFVRNSLGSHTVADRERCYKRLFSEALHVRATDNSLSNILKIDIGTYLIQDLIRIKEEHAENDLARSLAGLELHSLQRSIFAEDTYSSFLFILLNEGLQKFHAQVDEVRTIMQRQAGYYDQLTGLAKNIEITKPDKLKGMHNQITSFHNDLARLKAFFKYEDYDGEKVLDRARAYLKSLADFMEFCTTNPSKETLIQQYEGIFPKIEKLAKESTCLMNAIKERQSQRFFMTTEQAISDLLFTLKIAELSKACERPNSILEEVIKELAAEAPTES